MGKKILKKIKITPLKIIKLSTGDIMRALNKNELKNNWNFGEAYFSFIKYNISHYILRILHEEYYFIAR